MLQSPVTDRGTGVPTHGAPVGPSRRALARNTAFSFAQQFAAIGLAIVLVPYMLWTLGPEKYGLWLTLQLFNILGLASLAELGFQGAIVRYLARFFFERDREAFRAVLACGFALFIAIGALVGVVVIAFAQTGFVHAFPIDAAYHAEMRLGLTIVGAGLVAAFPALVIKAYFASRQELARTKVWELADRVIFALGVFVLLQMTDSIAMLVLFEQVLAAVLMVVFAIAARRGSEGWFSVRPALSAGGHFGGLLRLSHSVFSANLASLGFNRLPEVFVGALLGPVTLTAYQLATRIPRVIKTLQGSLNAAVLPHIAGIDTVHAGDGGKARGAFALQGLRANYLVATPLLLGTALFAPVVLQLWVGEEYRSLASYMAAFALFQGLFLASNFCAATLTQHGHFRFFVRFNLALLAGFVAALAFGLERLGLAALFIALMVAGAAMFAGVLIVLRAAHGIAVREALRVALAGPVALSGLVGGVTLTPAAYWLAEGRWLIGGVSLAVGGAAYLAALFVLVLTREERRMLAGLGAGLRNRLAKAPD